MNFLSHEAVFIVTDLELGDSDTYMDTVQSFALRTTRKVSFVGTESPGRSSIVKV